MKITIEGEPKEIAAYELALKDGKTVARVEINYVNLEKSKQFMEHHFQSIPAILKQQ